MINNEQKALIHMYRRAAALDELTYRDLLRTNAGCVSAADRNFPQHGFDQVMAALEHLLFVRVDRGEVRNPIGHSRRIKSRTYWRDRLPKTGHINNRQYHLIRELWIKTAPLLNFVDPKSAEAEDYLLRMINKATGRGVGFDDLTHAEAGLVINALKDRLSYALRQPTGVN